MMDDDDSPLRRFLHCKSSIHDAFILLSNVIVETEDFLTTIDGFAKDENERILLSLGDPDYDTIHQQKDIHQFRGIVDNIGTLLARDNMKVVFVGHTSNGKSTIINSMLGDIVLPMGIGHTTHCFCSVEGTDNEPFMRIGESTEKHNITTVKQVAHALSPEATDDRQEIVRLFWEKKKCKLLNEGVVLMDTPGLDIDENYDMWIDKYCIDADVFVLVANGESTLKQTEMTFLKHVSEKLSRPNVFVLFNRWDGSDMEEDAEGVKSQHRDKAVRFLTNDLRLDIDGNDRVFFVSAKEMLLARTKNKPATEPEALQRATDFDRFERNFAECISASAIQTKFESHVARGLDIAARLKEWLDKITVTAKIQQTECRARLDDRNHQLEDLDEKRENVIALCEREVDTLGDAISSEFERAYEDVIGLALTDTIRRFDYAIFTGDNLIKYKERLLDYMGKELCLQLQELCAEDLDETYVITQRNMEQHVKTVIPGNNIDFRVQHMTKTPIVPTLFTAGVLDTFHEDVQFRFSLGWSALGPRLLGYSTFNVIDGILFGRPGSENDKNAQPTARDVATMAVLPAASAYLPLLTVGATIAAKPATWKIVLTIAGVWGALYVWERLTFTNAARERLFKKQFVDHARVHYRHIMMQVALNVKSHFLAGASGQLERLRLQINERKGMLWKEKGMLESAVGRLVKVINTGESASAHAAQVTNQLEEFSTQYLPQHRVSH